MVTCSSLSRAALVAILLFFPVNALALDPVIFDQTESADSFWGSFGSATDPTFVAADDFTIDLGAGNYAITGARWAGGFFDTDLGELLPYEAVDQDFWILIYEDGPGFPLGAPDLAFPGDAVASRLVTVTPTDANGSLGFYQAEFPAITLADATTYWVSIVAAAPVLSENWSWSALQDAGNGHQNFPDPIVWFNRGFEFFFDLYGVPDGPVRQESRSFGAVKALYEN